MSSDSLLQFIICYICYSIGSNVQLRNVKVFLVENPDGTMSTRFERLSTGPKPDSVHSVPRPVEKYEPYNPNNALSESVLGRASYYNRKECDLIMQQFVEGLESQSSFLSDLSTADTDNSIVYSINDLIVEDDNTTVEFPSYEIVTESA
jgi:hypothetical protein